MSNKVIILQDLGTRVTNSTTGKKRRYLLVQCLECLEIRSATAGVVKKTGSTICHRCTIINRNAIKQEIAKLEFETRCHAIHDNKYDYSKVNYKGSKTKVTIICPEHGDFMQIPNSHTQGIGCPSCSSHGFNINKPAILYYFKIKDCYKIGVTNRTIEDRYNKKDFKHIKELQVWHFPIGKDALDIETKVLQLFKTFKYLGASPFTDGTKSHECFYIDIKDEILCLL